MMITSFFHVVKKKKATLFWGFSEAARMCSYGCPLTSTAWGWGKRWLFCFPTPPTPSATTWGTTLSSVVGLWGTTGLVLQPPPAHRSDRYGNAIFRPDRLISGKGDYFPTTLPSASPHIQYLYPSVPLCPDAPMPGRTPPTVARISRHAVI